MGKRKQYDFYYQVILNGIDGDGYTDNPPETDKEKMQFLFDTFNAEYGWRMNQGVGAHKAISEWLQGLPSAVYIPFYNVDILDMAHAAGSLPDNATEKQEDRILENYWDFMAMRVINLLDHYKINYLK